MKVRLTGATLILGLVLLVFLAGCRNLSPVASFTCTPSSGQSPLTVFVDASASHDTDGTIVTYQWAFGDGSNATAVMASHTYTTTTNRTYSVTLTVTDDAGSQATDTHAVSVTLPPPNSLPVASFTRTPSSGDAPLNVSFDASGSYDSDGSITSYAWDFGDGGSSLGVTAAHTYNSAGTYIARLTVSDNHGATGTITHSVIVQTPTPSPSQIDVVITASESKIDILDYKIEKHMLWDELVGHAKNITTSTIDSIFIKGRLLDSGGVQLNTTSDMASDVLPNATFAFTLYIWEPESVKTLDIYEITTYTW